jgi:hypothetical protein
MKLSDATISILKNYASINQGIKIVPGNTLSTISPLKTLLSKAQIPDTFTNTFCIYDLNRFLSVLSLFKEPELEFTDSSVVIRGGKQKVTYRFCDEKVIVAAPAKQLDFPANPEVSFTLTPEALHSAIKANSILGLPDITFVGHNGKLYLRSVNTKDAGSDDFDEEIGDTSSEFCVVFKPEYLSKILPTTYKVELSSKKISRFTSDTVTYFIATETNTTFG